MDTLLLIAKVKHSGNPLIFSLPAQHQNRMISAIQRIYGSVRGKTRMHTHFTKLFDSRPNVIGQCSLLIAHSGILPVKRRSMKISTVIRLVAIIAITPAVKLTDFVAGAQYHETLKKHCRTVHQQNSLKGVRIVFIILLTQRTLHTAQARCRATASGILRDKII